MTQTKPSPKEIAAQLRQPSGKAGLAIAELMANSNAQLIQLAFKATNIKKDAHLLEIGFGGGAHVADWLKQSADIQYSGIDFSKVMVELANENNHDLVDVGNVSFQFGDVANLPFPNHQFDTIITVNTLYFWPDIAKGLAEIKRVLKPDGRLVLGLRPKNSVAHLPFVKHGFALFDPHEIEDILQTNGFHSIAHHLEEEAEIEWDGEKFSLLGMAVSGTPST